MAYLAYSSAEEDGDSDVQIVFEWFVIIYWAQLALFCKTLSHTYDTMQGKNKGHFDDISTLSLQRDDLILSPINA